MDEKRFYIYFRMNFECFDEILARIENDIRKQHSKFREPIEPAERLAVTLRFLATGDSYKTIGHSFRMGFSTVSKIVEEVCCAIWTRLQPIYMPEPTTEIWETSISAFKDIWNFPNCLGSIDGKISIVLMAIVDSYYKFISIDVGAYGKNSDGGIFEASNMGRKFETGTFNIPATKLLPGKDEPLLCVLVGDEAFTLSSYLMRLFPYRQVRQDARKEKFNYHLCRARRVVENAFGILAQKWRLFFSPLEMKVPTAISIVKATCVLHNLLRSKNVDEHFHHLTEYDPRPVQGLNNLPADRRRATNYAFY
nr:uncharacterized protein LOC111509151 [Leptinotarsa decemlineata]